MNKIWLITKREYFTRIRKRSFILATFLVPLFTLAVYVAAIFLFLKKDALSDAQTVIVNDPTGEYINRFQNTPVLSFTYSADTTDKARKEFLHSADGDYLLSIASEEKITLLGRKKAGVGVVSEIQKQMNAINRTRLLVEAGIDTSILSSVKSEVAIATKEVTEEGEKDSSASLAYIIAILSAFLIETSLTIYAAQVMRGVIEEKTNRIVEIVVSSVKPFQLMLGKIIGVGMVGLTQFLLWIVLSLSVLAAGQSVLSKDDAKKITNSRLVVSDPGAGGITGDSPDTKATFSLGAFKEISFPYIIGCFLFYFLAGFFLYSSIFAAIGSTADDDEETQPFMVPVLLLLGFTLLVSINVVMNNPDSTLAFWLSMIPFTAPIAMMARIPFGVPGWELALSMTLMVASFLFMTWIAARIYRVGILMYGKKASFKELGKWLFQRRSRRS